MSETLQAYQRMRHEVSLLEATLQDEPMAVHRITLRYLLEIAAIHLPPQGMDLVAQSASSLRGEHERARAGEGA